MFTHEDVEDKPKKSRWDSEIDILEAFHLYGRSFRFDQRPLAYPMNGLKPILSEEMMMVHYGL